ncbi:MAG: DUF1559 domain-containing protein [Planctomycetota bacterium]
MRERLVKYLLGELNAREAAEVESLVAASPELRRQLDELRRCLPCDLLGEPASGGQSVDALREPAHDATIAAQPPPGSYRPAEPASEPPAGLADRTADSVNELVLGLAATRTEATPESAGGGRSGRPGSFTFVDGGVAAGVVVALGMMLFPALQQSREASRRTACEYNLGKLGRALQQYADSHGGLLPMVHPGENAGVFSMRLADDGFVDRRQLAEWLVCPSSELGQQAAGGGRTVSIPRREELAQLRGAALGQARRTMGGSYAYRLGYLDGPLYRPITLTGNSRSPVLSDAPNPGSGRWQSSNHGGRGQNVLFQDGHVRYQVDCLLEDDNLFVNAHGNPAAGAGWDDAVLVPSDGTPGVLAAPGRPRQFRATIWRIRTR